MLPGLLCCLSLLGVGEEQDDFIQAWFKFFESWSGPPVQCIIYQSTSSRYSEFRQRVDLDNLYDIESSLDVCENLNHVVRAEASRHSILKQAHITLWDNLWRATKYFFLVVSFKEYMNAVNKAVMAVVALHTQVTSLDHAEEPDSVMEFLIRWSNTEKTRSKLRRHFTIATHCILPLLIPEAGRTHLQMKANDAIATAIHSKSPKRVNATADPTQPSEAEVSDIDWNTLAITPASRSTIWCYMKAKIDAVANESFENCQPIDLDEAHHLLGHCNSTPNNASLQMRNTVLAFIKHDLFESPRLKDHMALSGELIQNELISVIETGLELAPEAMLNGAFQESIAR